MEHLEKINKKYQVIKLIDKQILDIENLAKQLTEGENIIYFSFMVENLTDKTHVHHLNIMDIMDAHARLASMTEGHPLFMSMERKNPEKEKHTFKIDTKTTLLALQIILQSFNLKRAELKKEIADLMTTTL